MTEYHLVRPLQAQSGTMEGRMGKKASDLWAKRYQHPAQYS